MRASSTGSRPGADDRRGPQQLLDPGSGLADPHMHGRLQRSRHTVLTGLEATQDLDHEQRVPPGPTQNLLRELPATAVGRPTAVPPRPRADRGRDGTPTSASMSSAGAPSAARTVATTSRRARCQPSGDVVDELHRGYTGVVQIVQAQHDRRLVTQVAQQADHGVEHEPATQVGVGCSRGSRSAAPLDCARSELGHLGHQAGQGRRPVAQQALDLRR